MNLTQDDIDTTYEEYYKDVLYKPKFDWKFIKYLLELEYLKGGRTMMPGDLARVVDKSDKDWCVERLETIKNLCDIAIFLHSANWKGTHLESILELLLLESQTLVDDFCVVRDGTN